MRPPPRPWRVCLTDHYMCAVMWAAVMAVMFRKFETPGDRFKLIASILEAAPPS